MNLYGNISDTKALPGMLYGMNPKSVISYPAGDTCSFGKGLFLKDGVVSHTKSTGKYVGMALFHQCESGEYKAKDAVACMNDGMAWVVLAESMTNDVADGLSAYVTPSGLYTTDANDGESSPTAYDLVGKFKSAKENGLALVDFSK